HFFFPVNDFYKSIFINNGDVTCFKPLSQKHFFRFFRPVPVALHHLGPLTQSSPFSPSSRSLPSSSTTFTSVLGKGRPMVPKRWVPSMGLQETTGDVSVNPYPSERGHPVRASHLSATDF